MVADQIILTVAENTPNDLWELLRDWLSRKVAGRSYVYTFDHPGKRGNWKCVVMFPSEQVQ